MTHLDICNTTYGQKKKVESQISSLTPGENRPDPRMCRWRATDRWKALDENYNFAL
jgi:hypothetical protein